MFVECLFCVGGLSRQLSGKESACQCRRLGSIHGLGRFPGKGNGNPPQYFCLKNSMDRGAWQAIVHRVTESDTTELLSTCTLCVEFYVYHCNQEVVKPEILLYVVLQFVKMSEYYQCYFRWCGCFRSPQSVSVCVCVYNIFSFKSSVQFSRSVMSDSLQPHESQHARPLCPSLTPGVHSNSCPSSR